MIASALSAQFVRTAKPGRYCDGDGLYLLVKKSGARFWVFRYKVNGFKLREAGLGRAGEGRNSVRLAEAREKASTLFRQVKSGIDPLSAREAMAAAAKAAAQDAAVKRVTFREVAQRYIDGHAPSWRNPKHAAQWRATIETYANPVFGDLPVGDVATTHVLAAIEPIWLGKPETASRLRGRVERILDFAKTRGWRAGENPAAWKGHLALTLPARSKVRKVGPNASLTTSERKWDDELLNAVLIVQRARGLKTRAEAETFLADNLKKAGKKRRGKDYTPRMLKRLRDDRDKRK
jgi:hypothetical protein